MADTPSFQEVLDNPPTNPDIKPMVSITDFQREYEDFHADFIERVTAQAEKLEGVSLVKYMELANLASNQLPSLDFPFLKEYHECCVRFYND